MLVVAVLKDDFLYVLTSRYSLYKINPEDGRVLWANRYWNESDNRVTLYEQTGVIFVGTHLIFGTPQGELKVVDANSGELIYTRPLMEKVSAFQDVSALVAGPEVLYASSYSAGIVAFGAELGLRLFKLPDEHGITQLLYQGGSLFAASARGFLISIDPITGKVLWKKKCLSGTPAPLLFQDGVLYAGSSSGPILLVEPKQGRILDRLNISGTFSGFGFFGDVLYTLTKHGFLAAYKGCVS